MALAALLAGCGSAAETVSTSGEPSSNVVTGEEAPASPGGQESDAAETTTEVPAESEAKLEVADQGFTQLDGGEYGSPEVTFGVVITNSGNAMATDARLQIAFKDDSGAVVDTAEEYLTVVLPGSSVAVGSSIYDVDGVTDMTVQLMPGSTEALEDEPANFEVVDVNTRQSEFGLTTTATVKSPFTRDLEDLQAVAIYRDGSGAVIGGAFTFINFVPAGGEGAVSIDAMYEGLEPAATDVYIGISALTLLADS